MVQTMRNRTKLTNDEKKEEVERAIEEAIIHRKKKRFQKGIDLLVEALRYQVEEDQIYYQLGNIYYDAGDLDRAEYAYQQAIEKNKEHVNAHHNLSIVYKRKGRIWEFVRMKKKAARMAIKTRIK
jgi:tetratricopeptide (TPR) repeat protein